MRPDWRIRLVVIASTLLGVATGSCSADDAPPKKAPTGRVVIISIDGLRPDCALRADMPNFRKLLARGSYTFWARTVAEAYTLPAHVSMLTGVTPQRHGVTWNEYIEESYPEVPTVFERAKQAGYTTGAVTGKMKFIVFNKPGVLDWFENGNEDEERDPDIARKAVEMIMKHRPQLLFVHLGDVDDAGHRFGWGSRLQIKAIEEADAAVGRVLGALEEQQVLEETFVMLTSDHGGAGLGHAPEDPRSRFVPWVIAGPGIRQNFDLTLVAARPVRIEDTCATVYQLLNISGETGLDGKSVRFVLESTPLPATRPVAASN